jgi:hypothetical protein
MSAFPVSQSAFAEAIVEIAQKDPPLAVVLIHHHECIEDAKREARHAKTAAAEAKDAFTNFIEHFNGWTKFAGTTLVGICGTLILGVCAIAWAVLTHPHGFAQ